MVQRAVNADEDHTARAFLDAYYHLRSDYERGQIALAEAERSLDKARERLTTVSVKFAEFCRKHNVTPAPIVQHWDDRGA
jgi:phage shock protein A